MKDPMDPTSNSYSEVLAKAEAGFVKLRPIDIDFVVPCSRGFNGCLKDQESELHLKALNRLQYQKLIKLKLMISPVKTQSVAILPSKGKDNPSMVFSKLKKQIQKYSLIFIYAIFMTYGLDLAQAQVMPSIDAGTSNRESAGLGIDAGIIPMDAPAAQRVQAENCINNNIDQRFCVGAQVLVADPRSSRGPEPYILATIRRIDRLQRRLILSVGSDDFPAPYDFSDIPGSSWIIWTRSEVFPQDLRRGMEVLFCNIAVPRDQDSLLTSGSSRFSWTTENNTTRLICSPIDRGPGSTSQNIPLMRGRLEGFFVHPGMNPVFEVRPAGSSTMLYRTNVGPFALYNPMVQLKTWNQLLSDHLPGLVGSTARVSAPEITLPSRSFLSLPMGVNDLGLCVQACRERSYGRSETCQMVLFSRAPDYQSARCQLIHVIWTPQDPRTSPDNFAGASLEMQPIFEPVFQEGSLEGRATGVNSSFYSALPTAGPELRNLHFLGYVSLNPLRRSLQDWSHDLTFPFAALDGMSSHLDVSWLRTHVLRSLPIEGDHPRECQQTCRDTPSCQGFIIEQSQRHGSSGELIIKTSWSSHEPVGASLCHLVGHIPPGEVLSENNILRPFSQVQVQNMSTGEQSHIFGAMVSPLDSYLQGHSSEPRWRSVLVGTGDFTSYRLGSVHELPAQELSSCLQICRSTQRCNALRFVLDPTSPAQRAQCEILGLPQSLSDEMQLSQETNSTSQPRLTENFRMGDPLFLVLQNPASRPPVQPRPPRPLCPICSQNGASIYTNHMPVTYHEIRRFSVNAHDHPLDTCYRRCLADRSSNPGPNQPTRCQATHIEITGTGAGQRATCSLLSLPMIPWQFSPRSLGPGFGAVYHESYFITDAAHQTATPSSE